MGGSRQRLAGFRRKSRNRRQVFGGKRFSVFLQQLQRGVLPLNGIHPALFCLKCHFNGNGAGSRPNIPADRVFRQPQLGQANGAHLAFGHGYVFLPEENGIRQPVGHNRLRRIIFNQCDTQAFISSLRQRFCRTTENPFVQVAQALAHMHRHMTQTGLYQCGTHLTNSVFAAHQSKHPAMGANIGDNIVIPAVKAHGIHILVGGLQSGAQGYERTQARNYLCLASLQKWQQLFGTAEKTRVPGHHHGKPPVFPVGKDIVRNGSGSNGTVHGLSGGCCRIQHPLGTDQAIGTSNRRFRIHGHSAPASGPQADNADTGRPDTAKSFT